MKIQVVLAALVMTFALVQPASAATGGSCTAPIVRYTSIQIGAFAGHWVKAAAKVCLRKYGPGRIQYTSTPVISFPTRIVGGGILEDLSLATKPYVTANSSTRVAYDFVVHQAVWHFGGQNFTFRVAYSDAHYCLRMGESVVCKSW